AEKTNDYWQPFLRVRVGASKAAKFRRIARDSKINFLPVRDREKVFYDQFMHHTNNGTLTYFCRKSIFHAD
ncbi:MAG TPA: hypothetical protein VMB21_04880, partial [Candidatus Limnocylindria bacterium]|nr:hypothetical protein [Candidatus Limnocylindria bacterium]